jgi:excisionase family DNA binding protein
MVTDGLVTKYEAADLVGVSWRTIERWVAEGRLARFAVGKHGAAYYLRSEVRQAERHARHANPVRVKRHPRTI